jgi:hypothetical protein
MRNGLREERRGLVRTFRVKIVKYLLDQKMFRAKLVKKDERRYICPVNFCGSPTVLENSRQKKV